MATDCRSFTAEMQSSSADFNMMKKKNRARLMTKKHQRLRLLVAAEAMPPEQMATITASHPFGFHQRNVGSRALGANVVTKHSLGCMAFIESACL